MKELLKTYTFRGETRSDLGLLIMSRYGEGRKFVSLPPGQRDVLSRVRFRVTFVQGSDPIIHTIDQINKLSGNEKFLPGCSALSDSVKWYVEYYGDHDKVVNPRGNINPVPFNKTKRIIGFNFMKPNTLVKVTDNYDDCKRAQAASATYDKIDVFQVARRWMPLRGSWRRPGRSQRARRARTRST